MIGCLLVFSTLWAFYAGPQPRERPEVTEAIRLAIDARYEEALEIFQRTRADDPQDPLLNYFVGITHLKMGRLIAASAFLAEAVAQDAPFPQAYFWLARVLGEREQPENAREILDRGLERFPRNRDLQLLVEELRKPPR